MFFGFVEDPIELHEVGFGGPEPGRLRVEKSPEQDPKSVDRAAVGGRFWGVLERGAVGEVDTGEVAEGMFCLGHVTSITDFGGYARWREEKREMREEG